MNVYHFSDTGRLPWIVSTDELRPGANAVGGYPSPEFIWATSDARGSRTAAGGAQGYREDKVRLVRFTVDAADFEPWSGIGARYPAWTPEQIARLENSARRKGDDPATWWCRVDPLPLARTVLIETRAYRGPGWQPWITSLVVLADRDDMLGVVLGGEAFLSRKVTIANGRTGYETTSIPARALDVRVKLARPSLGLL